MKKLYHIILGALVVSLSFQVHALAKDTDIVVKEILPYVDAIAVQPTSREFNFDFFDPVYEKYGKPIYIADHVSSFATARNPVTMGQAAKDPDSYGAYYRRYVTAALSRPYMIGYNKCQYQDHHILIVDSWHR